MKIFYVVYDAGDGEETERISATSAGQAFVRCLELHPDVRLVKAYCEGGFNGGWGTTTYEVPSMAKPEPLPEEHLEQTTMKL